MLKKAGILVVMLLIVVGLVFASSFSEGYYRASDDYVLVLMQNSGSSWTIVYMDDNGRKRGEFEGEEKSSNAIYFTAYGKTYRISRNSTNSVVESYEGRTYTYYQELDL